MATEFQRASSEYDLAASLLRLEARNLQSGRRSGLERARQILDGLMAAAKDETAWYALRDAREAMEREIR